MTRMDLDPSSSRRSSRRSSCRVTTVAYEALTRILAPDLPPQFKKSSQQTLLATITRSTTEESTGENCSAGSVVVAARSGNIGTTKTSIRRGSSTTTLPPRRNNDDGIGSSGETLDFIPGITAKAKCLEPSSELVQQIQAKPKTKSIRRRSTAICSSTGQSTMTHNSYLTWCHSQRLSSSLSSIALGSTTSTQQQEEEGQVEKAAQLYDSVFTSIQKRRSIKSQEDDVTLDELEYQQMLQELKRDASKNIKHDVTLRDQVETIRGLLNDYYDRKQEYAKTTGTTTVSRRRRTNISSQTGSSNDSKSKSQSLSDPSNGDDSLQNKHDKEARNKVSLSYKKSW